MNDILRGVRVLEVATHVFVPAGAAVLAEWGADVIKVEHPVTGDAYRGLVTAGLRKTYAGSDPSFQAVNRSKQSIGIDLHSPAGREVLGTLVDRSDVFLTNFLGDARRALAVEADDIRTRNPSIVYVRGTGLGPHGPEADRPGYDATAYWARAGIGDALTPQDADWPITQRSAFGDLAAGLAVAGAVSAALYKRAMTGEGSIVDVSLLGVGLWQLQPDVVASKLGRDSAVALGMGRGRWNPLAAYYRTRDDRFLFLCMLDADTYWPDFCRLIGHPEWVDDPRFVDMNTRREHADACVALLDQVFAKRPLAEWRALLSDLEGAWSPVQTAEELHDDPQVAANGYLTDLELASGTPLTVVTSPVKFDEQTTVEAQRAPEPGEHTESILLEAGYTWSQIATLKATGAIN